MSATSVQIVIVAYQNPALLDACLGALGGAYPVVVVDNSSDSAVADVVHHHGAQYVDPGRNLGFGAGVNVALAMRHRDADVLLLNPDARIDAEGIRNLQRHLGRGRARVGGVTPTLSGPDGPQRVMWPFPHPARAWLEAIGLGRLNRAQDFAVGAVLLLSAQALADVGLFDERYFLYAEETDWQRRARKMGWSFIVVPEVTAWHLGGGTSSDPRRRELYFFGSQEVYVRKWFGTGGWQGYRLAVLLGALARAALLRGTQRQAALRRAGLFAYGPKRQLDKAVASA